jgi:hypothetical protein
MFSQFRKIKAAGGAGLVHSDLCGENELSLSNHSIIHGTGEVFAFDAVVQTTLYYDPWYSRTADDIFNTGLQTWIISRFQRAKVTFESLI